MSMVSSVLLFIFLYETLCETIDRSTPQDYSPIMCISFPCIINCNAVDSCRNTNISCPLSGDGDCHIHLIEDNAARDSTIYTGNAQNIFINCNGPFSLYSATIHAYQRKHSKLTINVLNVFDPLYSSTIYGTYGENSELNIMCGSPTVHGDYLCANMIIYDDYSTNVNLRSYSYYGFHSTEVRTNISDIIPTINKNGIDPTYRGTVRLWTSSFYYGAFYLFKYYGTDHGNWFIESQVQNGFYESVIYADHSFITNESYSINVTGSTEVESIGSLTLYAAQNNVNIVLLGQSLRAFQTTWALVFKLICNSPLDNLVINSLSMTARDSTDAFQASIITINNNIRNIIITGEATSVSGFDIITISIGGTILNNAIFTSNGDHACLSESTIIINKINGNLEMYNNGDRGLAFYDSSITITNGVNGNVLLYDRSTAESKAFQISDITIGNIGGDLYVRSDATAANSFSSTVFKFANISGNAEFIDNAVIGPSFASTSFEIESINGNLLFAALVDNGNQAFDILSINIGTVKGDVYFVCNTYGGFSEGTININTIEGIGMFNGTASGGYEYYSTDFNIQHASYLLFYISSPVLSFYISQNTFGNGVGKVQIIVDSVTDGIGRILEGSNWDCRNCDEFSIQCLNYGDCGGAVKVYCPENNQRDTCQIHCDSNSQCDDINLFTTNGYCSDARFYCHDPSNMCSFTGGSTVCVFGASQVPYGSTMYSCNMIQDTQNNNQWICQNAATSNCVNTCTKRPTTDPTHDPTSDPTNDPTIIPTLEPTFSRHPTSNPTINPTYEPTTIPTFNPSIQPTNPTEIPTSIPTFNPSIQPTNEPTYIPTVFPVQEGGIKSTFEETSSVEEVQSKNESLGTLIMDNLLVIVIIIISLLLINCILVIIVYKRKHRKVRNNVDNINTGLGVEMQKVQSVEVMSETDMQTDINGVDIGKQNVVVNDTYSNKNTLKYWLNDIGLDEYFDIFVKEGFGDDISQMETLETLTNDQLQSMGIQKIAHRNLILSRIEKLNILVQHNDINNDDFLTMDGNTANDSEDETEEMFVKTETKGEIIETQSGDPDIDDELYNNPTKITKA
eukprot:134866_1